MKAVYLNVAWFTVGLVACVQLIPEKAVVVNYNEKYIKNSSIFITKHGRNYYLNIVVTNKHTWDNNVTVNLIKYDYVRNDYKPSFTQLHFRLCEMIKTDPYIGGMVVKTGLTCPLYSKEHRLLNMTLPGGEFKYILLFNKCMVQLQLSLTSSNEIIGTANVYFNISRTKI